MKRRLNINEFIWFVILLSFSYYFYKLMYSGEIVNFMHPKMIKYVYVGFIAISILAIYQFFNIFGNFDGREIKVGYIMFIIPILLGFFVNPKGLNAYAVQNRTLSLFQKGNTISVSKYPLNQQSNIEIINGEIVINDENYTQVMDQIYSDIGKYKGKKITVNGFVYRDKDFKADQFVAARMLLSCCAADAEVVGFMCRYNKSDGLTMDKWVKVVGIIEEESINTNNGNRKVIPAIKVEKLINIEEPVNKYLYQ